MKRNYAKFLLCILPLWGNFLSEQPALASIQEIHVDVQCKRIDLSDCANLIRNNTGYTIIFPYNYISRKVNVSADNLNLTIFLGQLATSLSLNNYYLECHEAEKIIRVKVIGEEDPSTDEATKGQLTPGAKHAIETAPESIRDLLVESDAPYIQTEDDEVLPPKAPGERGLTLRELHTIESSYITTTLNMLDVEVLPPGSSEEKRITLRQLNVENAQEELNKALAPPSEELPPSQPGTGTTWEQPQGEVLNRTIESPLSPFPPTQKSEAPQQRRY